MADRANEAAETAGWPAITIEEARSMLCAPDAPFEMTAVLVGDILYV